MEFKLELIESDKNVRWHNLLHSYTSNWGLQWNWNEEKNMSSSVESRLNLNVYATLNSHCLQLKYYNICNAISFNSHRTLQIAHITENKDTVPAVGDREKLLIIWLHQNYDNWFIGRNKNQIVVCDVLPFNENGKNELQTRFSTYKLVASILRSVNGTVFSSALHKLQLEWKSKFAYGQKIGFFFRSLLFTPRSIHILVSVVNSLVTVCDALNS